MWNSALFHLLLDHILTMHNTILRSLYFFGMSLINSIWGMMMLKPYWLLVKYNSKSIYGEHIWLALTRSVLIFTKIANSYLRQLSWRSTLIPISHFLFTHLSLIYIWPWHLLLSIWIRLTHRPEINVSEIATSPAFLMMTYC